MIEYSNENFRGAEPEGRPGEQRFADVRWAVLSGEYTFLNCPDLPHELGDMQEGTSRVVITTYYALTTLSVVGFGDWVPVNNGERVFCVFILLLGVNIFSYAVSELRGMIGKIINLDADRFD